MLRLQPAKNLTGHRGRAGAYDLHELAMPDNRPVNGQMTVDSQFSLLDILEKVGGPGSD